MKPMRQASTGLAFPIAAITGMFALPAQASLYDGMRGGQCASIPDFVGLGACSDDAADRLETCETAIAILYPNVGDDFCRWEAETLDAQGEMPPGQSLADDFREYRKWTACGDCGCPGGVPESWTTCWLQCQCGPCDPGDLRWVDGVMEVCVRPGDGGCNTWQPTDEPYTYYECLVDEDDQGEDEDDQGEDEDRRGRGRLR